MGLLCPFFGEGELGPHLTQCRVDRGLPPYKWHLDLYRCLATTDMGQKFLGSFQHARPLGEGSWVPIWHNVARAESYLNAKFHVDPSNRFATIHQRHRQRIRGFTTMRYINLRFTYLLTYRQTDRQRSDSIGRTVFTNGRLKISHLVLWSITTFPVLEAATF